jgi:cytochrome c biogenesis protein CcmG/thiol:disulfide interchange protein DsbE
MTDGKRTVLWGLAALLAVSLFGIAMAAANLLGYQPGGASHDAPGFTLPIAGGEGAAEGDRVSLDALRGKVVLLDFWASWCGPCRRSIPILNGVHQRYGSRVEMYGVNVEQEQSNAYVARAHQAFAAEFPSLRDEDGSVQAAYAVTSIPTLVLIDREGVVRWVYSGVPDGDEVADRIDALLGDDG